MAVSKTRSKGQIGNRDWAEPAALAKLQEHAGAATKAVSRNCDSFARII
jgi:hypothetical protein